MTGEEDFGVYDPCYWTEKMPSDPRTPLGGAPLILDRIVACKILVNDPQTLSDSGEIKAIKLTEHAPKLPKILLDDLDF